MTGRAGRDLTALWKVLLNQLGIAVFFCFPHLILLAILDVGIIIIIPHLTRINLKFREVKNFRHIGTSLEGSGVLP